MTQLVWFGDSFSVPVIDLIAFAWFAVTWVGYAEYAKHVSGRRKNLVSLMSEYRLAWMQAMLRRENRITDMTAVGNLLRSISFFASTSIILQIGFFSMLGYRTQALDILRTIPFAFPSSPFLYEFKILLLMLVFIYAFFKFTWSLRQYNYLCIYICGAPLPLEAPETHATYAERGAKLMTNAAMHFNLGLRAYYYGMAVFAWFLHPYAFIAATTYVVWELYRREFFSHAYAILSGKHHAPI